MQESEIDSGWERNRQVKWEILEKLMEKVLKSI